MLGRRGPAQAAFTTPELKELGELAGADVIVDPADLELDAASELLDDDTNAQRNVEVLREYAAREPAGKPKRAPAALLRLAGRDPRRERVEGIEVVHNRLVADETGASAPCRQTSARRSRAGSSSAASATGASRSPESRSTRAAARSRTRAAESSEAAVPGVYCAGWIKRGPSGVIGTNKKDATETVELLARGRPRREAQSRRSERDRGNRRRAARPREAPARDLRGVGGDRP